MLKGWKDQFPECIICLSDNTGPDPESIDFNEFKMKCFNAFRIREGKRITDYKFLDRVNTKDRQELANLGITV